MAKYVAAPTMALTSGILVAILILAGGATWESFGVAQTAQEWSRHSLVVLGTVKDLNLAVTAAETGQRGYLLTGNDDYLAPYEEAIGHVTFLTGELQRLTADNPIQQDRLRTLSPMLQHRLEVMAQTIQIRRDSGFAAALRMVDTSVGRILMKQVEASFVAIGTEEQTLLATRLAASASRANLVRGLALGGTALGVLALFWIARLMDQSAGTDTLTGLLSRNKMWELLTAHNRERDPQMAAMLCVDLDRFRSVNEVFGSTIGDRLLIEVGRRLTPIAGRHYVGRLGSDDFAIFCIGVTPIEASELGVAAITVLARPFDAQGHRFHLTASVGVAHSDTTGAVDLRQGADDAMSTAKQRGGNQVVVFARSMHDTRKELAELEEDLRGALSRENELTMAYQPVVRLADRKLVAIEALARWTHPRLGTISPDRFIALAETRGLMIPLGLKLMDMTIRQVAQWYARYPGKCPVVNINISQTQFAAGDVIADLVKLLQTHSLPVSGFCIEVTEGAFVSADAIRALQDARQLGFKVAMDDFGVGYSSLSQLPRLPLTSVKLDRSFILQSKSPGGKAILGAVVRLAHALKLDVIAEGVEFPEELALVTECECDAVQGYLFSRPLRPEALDPWLSGDAPIAIAPAAVAVWIDGSIRAGREVGWSDLILTSHRPSSAR